MKYFIAYKQPFDSQNPWKKVFTLDEFESIPGTSRLEVLEAIKEGELSLLKDTEQHRIFRFFCNVRIRSKAQIKPFEKDTSEIWQQKKGRIVASFGAKRDVSRCAAAFASYATFRDPFVVKPMILLRSDFLQFNEYIQKKLGGHVTQVLLGDVENPELEFRMRSIYLKGLNLEKIPDFTEYLSHANKIKTIGFAIPDWEGRRLSFRITHWGGGQIFSPVDLFEHEIAKFLELLSQFTEPTNHDK